MKTITVSLADVTLLLNAVDSILDEMDKQGPSRDEVWYAKLERARVPLALAEERAKQDDDKFSMAEAFPETLGNGRDSE